MITVTRLGAFVSVEGHADDPRVCASVSALVVGMFSYYKGCPGPHEGNFSADLSGVPSEVLDYFDHCIQALVDNPQYSEHVKVVQHAR